MNYDFDSFFIENLDLSSFDYGSVNYCQAKEETGFFIIKGLKYNGDSQLYSEVELEDGQLDYTYQILVDPYSLSSELKKKFFEKYFGFDSFVCDYQSYFNSDMSWKSELDPTLIVDHILFKVLQGCDFNSFNYIATLKKFFEMIDLHSLQLSSRNNLIFSIINSSARIDFNDNYICLVSGNRLPKPGLFAKQEHYNTAIKERSNSIFNTIHALETFECIFSP